MFESKVDPDLPITAYSLRTRLKFSFLLRLTSCVIAENLPKLGVLIVLQEMRLSGFTHSFCLASWTLMAMLNGMTEYLLSGFELELYADTELHFVYWYLYDVLYHCEVQTIVRADNAVQENEAAYLLYQEVLYEVSIGHLRVGFGKRSTQRRNQNLL